MSTKIIDQIEELHKSLQTINDNDELIEIYNIFDQHQFEFLNHYYTKIIAEKFTELNIILKKGDYFTTFENGEYKFYKFIEGAGYFRNIDEMKNSLETGFFIKCEKFLKSGKLPKRTGDWTHEKYVVKIIRNAEDLNIKTIFNILHLTYDDIKYIEENKSPLIIDCEKD